MEEINGIILAGGESMRMGQNKAFLRWGEGTLIESIINKLEALFCTVFIVAKHSRDYSQLGTKILKDSFPGEGALVGIYTALLHSPGWVFVTGCDTPFLNTELIQYMCHSRRGYDAVVPCPGISPPDGWEPLHALYSRRCLKVVEKQLKKRDFKVMHLFSEIKVRKIGLKEVRRFDPELLSFFNINTPQDWEKAGQLL